MLRHNLLLLGAPLFLTYAGLLTNRVGLLDAAERKIPEQVVDKSEDALAKQLDVLGFAVRLSFLSLPTETITIDSFNANYAHYANYANYART